MIDGLRLVVTPAEVAERIDLVIAHHKKRIKIIEAEIRKVSKRPVEDFQEHIDKHFEEHHGERGFEGGPRPDAKKFKRRVLHTLTLAAESRRQMIERLAFTRDRLVKDDTFRLDFVEVGYLFPDSRDHGGVPCFGHIHDEHEEDGLDYFGPPSYGVEDEAEEAEGGAA